MRRPDNDIHGHIVDLFFYLDFACEGSKSAKRYFREVDDDGKRLPSTNKGPAVKNETSEE